MRGAPTSTRRTFSRRIAVLPAYNAAGTLERTIRDIPEGSVDEIILVDDGSSDSTAEIARVLGLHVIVHDRNRGYGANQKTCYRAALDRGADLIIMLHPDFQYDARLIPYIAGFLEMGVCDVMIGSRIRTRKEALNSGMPVWKYLANRVLTAVENMTMGQNLADFHSGFRFYVREVLEAVPFEDDSDGFCFDSELLAQAAYLGFRIGDAPVPSRYFPGASSIGFRDSIAYGFSTIRVLGEYALAKADLVHTRRFPRTGRLQEAPP